MPFQSTNVSFVFGREAVGPFVSRLSIRIWISTQEQFDMFYAAPNHRSIELVGLSLAGEFLDATTLQRLREWLARSDTLDNTQSVGYTSTSSITSRYALGYSSSTSSPKY